MRRLPLAPALAAVSLLAAHPVPVSAQWLHLRRGPGLVRVDTQGGISRVEGTPAGSGPSLRLDERVQLQVNGWLMDPRVLNLTASVTPTFGQHSTGLDDGIGKAQNTAFDVSTVLFPRRLISLTARTGRTSGFNAATLGARSEWVGRSTNLGLHMRGRYFPIRMTWASSEGTSSWRNTLLRDPFDAFRKVETFQAEVHNPKLTLSYRNERIDEEGYSNEERRTNATFLADHRIGWGRGSSLRSSFQIQDRLGLVDTHNRSWNETLGIQHTEAVRSQWEFRSRRWSSERDSYDALSFLSRFRFEPSESFRSGVLGQYRSSASGSGTREAGFQFMPYGTLAGELPFDGSGSLTVSGGFDRFTLREVAEDSWIGVVEEPHVVDRTLRFLLDQYRVDPASIQLWTDDLTVLLAEGLDYIKASIGDQIEIQILPGGRVLEGEAVRATYRYAALEGRRDSGAFVNAVGTADFRWIALRAGHSQRGGGDVAATAVGDPGYRETRFSVDFRATRTPLGLLGLSARRNMRTARGRSTTQDQIDADLTLPRKGPVDLRLRTTIGRFVADGVPSSRSLSSTLNGSWRAGRRTTLSGSATYLVWDREDGHLEQFVGMNVSLSWQWRAILIRATGDQSRRWNGMSTTGTRWSLSMIRRF